MTGRWQANDRPCDRPMTGRWQAQWQADDRPGDRPMTGRWQVDDRPSERPMTGLVTGLVTGLMTGELTGQWLVDDLLMTGRSQVDDSHAKGRWQADDRKVISRWLSEDSRLQAVVKPLYIDIGQEACTSSAGRARQSPHSRCWSRWTWMWDINVVRWFILILGCLPTLGLLIFQRLLSVSNYKIRFHINHLYVINIVS
jgi:hypothetical protein